MSSDEGAAISRKLEAVQSTRAAQAAEITRLQQGLKALKSRRSLEAVNADVAAARIAHDLANEELLAIRKQQGGGVAMTPEEECARLCCALRPVLPLHVSPLAWLQCSALAHTAC
mgnify:FL=1